MKIGKRKLINGVLERKFIPIIFSILHLRAFLDDRKTQARFPVKFHQQVMIGDKKPITKNEVTAAFYFDGWGEIECPYGAPGDVLWVKEKARALINCHDNSFASWDYYADMPDEYHIQNPHRYRQPNQMTKEAARLFLKIKSVRVERLWNLTDDDALAEGVEREPLAPLVVRWKCYTNDLPYLESPRNSFASLWHATKGIDSWITNPWVWVLELEKINKPESFLTDTTNQLKNLVK